MGSEGEAVVGLESRGSGVHEKGAGDDESSVEVVRELHDCE